MLRIIKLLFGKKETIGESIKYPHEIFPEILEWRKWDILDYDVHGYYHFVEVFENGDCALDFNKYALINQWANYKTDNFKVTKRKKTVKLNDSYLKNFAKDKNKTKPQK
jgi:hypothetical protein